MPTSLQSVVLREATRPQYVSIPSMCEFDVSIVIFTFDINESSGFYTSNYHNKGGKMQLIKSITLKHI